MWVLLEGTSRTIKVRAPLAGVKDLDDFAYVLVKEVENLKDVHPQNLSFLINYEPARLGIDFQNLANKATDVNPLIIRYPISNADLKVILMYGSHNKQHKCEIPHASNSFDHLKNYAKDILKIEGLEEEIENIYFVNEKTVIRCAYSFNNLVSRITNHNEVNIKLKINIERRKKYSDWSIKDVFRDILRKPICDSLSDLPRLNFDELPPLKTPISQEQFNKFIEMVHDHATVTEINNETAARFIINDFLSTAVSHMQRNLNRSLLLLFEKELNGTRGYGPIDYIIKILEIFLVLCEAKVHDMNQGVAQNIVQMHSAMERLLIGGETEPKMFGIVTTGILWRFVRWTGSLDQPTVHISEEYICGFSGNFENEKKMLKYIAQIIQAQVKAFGDDDNEHSYVTSHE